MGVVRTFFLRNTFSKILKKFLKIFRKLQNNFLKKIEKNGLFRHNFKKFNKTCVNFWWYDEKYTSLESLRGFLKIFKKVLKKIAKKALLTQIFQKI